jgi:hypothetical protein
VFEDDPLDGVYSFVEKDYARLQAGDVLFSCLDQQNTRPIQDWVEGLVFGGPESLMVLREILKEVGQLRIQTKEDIREVHRDFRVSLDSCGVQLRDIQVERALNKSTPEDFLSILFDLGVDQAEKQITCLQMFNDVNDLIRDLEIHLLLLVEIEKYISDWMWGLICESAQQGWVSNTEVIIS